MHHFVHIKLESFMHIIFTIPFKHDGNCAVYGAMKTITLVNG